MSLGARGVRVGTNGKGGGYAGFWALFGHGRGGGNCGTAPHQACRSPGHEQRMTVCLRCGTKRNSVSAQTARHSWPWPFMRTACTACHLHTRCRKSASGVHMRPCALLAASIAGVPRRQCPAGHNDAVLSETQASDPGQFIVHRGPSERTISSLPRPGPQCAPAVAHTDTYNRQFPAQASILTSIMPRQPLPSADHASASCHD